MKTRFFLDETARAPETHIERAMCLQGMGENALLAQVEQAAFAHDTAWLRTMLDVGVFSFAHELIHTKNPGASVEAYGKIGGILSPSTIQKAMVPGPDREFPLMAERLVLVTNTEFQAFFGDLVDHAIEQDQCYLAQVPPEYRGSGPPDTRNCRALMFSGLLTGACALDRPDLAEKLVSQRPQLVDTRVNLDWQCFALYEHIDEDSKHFDKKTKYLPAFFALQFGSQRCLEVLREARGKPLVYAYTSDNDFNVGLTPGKSSDGRPHPTFGILESFDILVPLCNPAVVRDAIEADCYLTRPEPRAKMLSLVMASLDESAAEKRMDAYAPVFEAVGGFAVDPTTTLVCALRSGLATYTRAHYGSVDWNALFKCDEPDGLSLATLTVLGTENCAADWIQRSDAALAGAIDHAVADGASALVRSVQAQSRSWSTPDVGPVLPQPMAGMVIQGFSQSLLALMKAGVDPTRPLLPEAWTLVQMADERNAPMAHTMRTFANRGRALDLLEEMEPKARPSP